MEAASRWLCSFYADKVDIQQVQQRLTCGHKAQLCSVVLRNPNSKFSVYHENKIAIWYDDKRAVTGKDIKFYIDEVNSNELRVSCYALCAGKATVKLDFGKWYQFEDQNINVDIVPSAPKYLRNVDVCCYETPLDTEHKPPEIGTLYCGIWSLLKFVVTDQHGNPIEQITGENHYEVTIEYSADKTLNHLDWTMRSGTIFAMFQPNMVGEMQMVVQFVDKRQNSTENATFPSRISIKIIHPPYSPLLSLTFLDGKIKQDCTAGEDFTFDLQFFDVFGNPAVEGLEGIEETCDVVVEAHSRRSALNQHIREQANVKKIVTDENLEFAVTVCFKITGLRRVRIIANSGSKSSTKVLHVKVLPSAPEHLNGVRFATNGALDVSFCADCTVMYRDQWSTFQAMLVDCYDNAVGELSYNYNVSLRLSSNNGKETSMEYKDAEIKNEIIGVDLKINKSGNYNLSITLTNKKYSDQVFRLKETHIQVCDATLYLSASEFRHSTTGVAGEVLQLDILPYDVFGCPMPASSSLDYIISGDILDSPVVPHEKQETVDFEIAKNNSHLLVSASIVLQKAGRRKIMISAGKKYRAKNRNIKPQCQEVNIDIAPSSPKYIRNVNVSRNQKPLDEESILEEGSTLYYGVKSLLKFEIIDEFGNLITKLGDERCYDVTIEYCDHNLLYCLNWKMRNAQIFATFSPLLVGESQVMVQLVDKRLISAQHSTCTYQMPINVLHPPCSPFLTLQSLDENRERRCTAGEVFVLKVQVYDVFGYHVPQDSKETCDISLQILSSQTGQTAVKQPVEERESVTRITTYKDLSYATTACFEAAGHRTVRLNVNSGSKSICKEIHLKVLPSSPHHLNHVRFTTNGALDDSFSADPKVMYKNQWSILEGSLVDCYENIVLEHGNYYNIDLKLSGTKGVEMVYKDAKIRSNTFKGQVKVDKAGTYNLLITLARKHSPEQVFYLETIQIEVKDAPLYLPASQFFHPDSGVAGEQIQLEILPVDVFGCPIHASSSTDYNLTGDILNSPEEQDGTKELMEFNITNEESIVKICVTIILNKVGKRQLMIFDSNKKSMKLHIHVRSNLNDVHLEQAAPKDTAYTIKEVALSILLFDRFHNEVQIDALQSIPDLVVKDGPDGLDCAKRSVESNQVTFQCHFKRSGKYDLCLVDKDGNPLGNTSVSIIVTEAPVDYNRSSITWLPQYSDIEDQPVFPEDETFRCCLKLKDVFNNDYDANIPKGNIQIKCNNTEVKNINVSCCPNKIGCYHAVVPLNNLLNDRQNPTFWCIVNGTKIEKPLVLSTFTKFKEYDDERNCKLQGFDIVCHGVKKNDIIKNQFFYIENIKRVCQLKSIPKVDDFEDHALIRFPSEEIKDKKEKCRRILLHFLRATYYREAAFESDKDREEWKERATENYMKSKFGERFGKERAHFCSQIKEKYAALMKRYHDAACEEYFLFFNAERHQSEIDLHGLLVADERKLSNYKKQLHSKGDLTPGQVNERIEEERDHGNEAIRKLRERLDDYDMEKAEEEGETWLEIIVGSGHHSKVRQQIRPTVEKYLERERQLEFAPVNKGALVVTFKKYVGKQPCFGQYYCDICHRSWQNGRSWVDTWQACYKCHREKNIHKECLPLKQRSLKKSSPQFFSGSQGSIPHLQELCGKCTQLKRPCPRA